MLTKISWSNYIIAVTVLILFWYLFLGFRFYKTEFKRILSGENKIKFSSLKNRKMQRRMTDKEHEDISKSNLSNSFTESFSTLEDAKELLVRLLNAVSECSENNKSKVEFTNYLKLIISEYPFVKNSSLRNMVNNALVSECEKFPQMIITHAEANGLWDEAV